MAAEMLKTRFAPSPTGLLHLGNVRTALFNWLLARREGGVFLLRVEDTDAVRGHERYAEALMEDLRWLGLEWQEGPGAEGGHGPYHQSQRGPIYQRHFDTLLAAGRAYPCFCTEHELEVARKTAIAAGRAPRYSGRCRVLGPEEVRARLSAGHPATLRFHVGTDRLIEFDDGVRGRQSFRADDLGDFVIRRSDGTPAFFFSNAVDDALMGVTLVVRGEDHLTNTPRQLLLLEALGLRAPAYAHIALVVGADGAPLSKRTGSRSVQELRTAGYLPGAINNYLARLGHTFDETGFLSPENLAAAFSAGRLHKAPGRFDEQQLGHWQREAIRHASTAELGVWAGAETRACVPVEALDEFLEVIRGNVSFPVEAQEWAKRLFAENPPLSPEARAAIMSAPRGFFEQAAAALEPNMAFRDYTKHLQELAGLKGKALFQPLRAALTGTLDGPELARLVPLIGIERARRRLEDSSNMVSG